MNDLNKSFEETLRRVLEEKFNVYYSDLDGQYHNGRMADAIVPFEDAVEALLVAIRENLFDLTDPSTNKDTPKEKES